MAFRCVTLQLGYNVASPPLTAILHTNLIVIACCHDNKISTKLFMESLTLHYTLPAHNHTGQLIISLPSLDHCVIYLQCLVHPVAQIIFGMHVLGTYPLETWLIRFYVLGQVWHYKYSVFQIQVGSTTLLEADQAMKMSIIILFNILNNENG